MTRQEAIELLVNATYSEEWQGNEQLTKAQHMAIDALQKEPSEDCISREYMLEKAQEWKNMYPDSDTAREALTMLMNEIDNAPSVVPIRAERDDDDTDYCNNDCEHCEWVTCPKEAFRKVFEVDDDVPVIVKVPSEKYDPSKSVWENIRKGNGISREILDTSNEGREE